MTFPFQSTRPLRGATGICLAFFKIELFQSTRPLRGATVWCNFLLTVMDISIHAPLAGRDGKYVRCGAVLVNISIHAPLAGRDGGLTMADYIERISIHAPLAGRDVPEAHSLLLLDISIHAPLAGRDPLVWDLATRKYLFQSTRPLRGATFDGDALHVWMCISIHAPLAGRDTHRRSPAAGDGHFNPRAPCGARLPPGNPWSRRPAHFNPRAPCGARPTLRKSTKRYLLFQSTRPLRGATARVGQLLLAGEDFNPRAPCGARPLSLRFALLHPEFQSTRPLRGATPAYTKRELAELFQSTRPLRGATVASIIFLTPLSISIHAPLAGRDIYSIAFPSYIW